MKIVIDTNVLISGVFFGGYPRRILTAIKHKKFIACASMPIIDEYEKIASKLLMQKQGHIDIRLFATIIANAQIISPTSHIQICRDPDDDKFLECAKDCQALYIVSGDKDLLTLKQYEDIQIITAREFCERYLNVES